MINLKSNSIISKKMKLALLKNLSLCLIQTLSICNLRLSKAQILQTSSALKRAQRQSISITERPYDSKKLVIRWFSKSFILFAASKKYYWFHRYNPLQKETGGILKCPLCICFTGLQRIPPCELGRVSIFEITKRCCCRVNIQQSILCYFDAHVRGLEILPTTGTLRQRARESSN